MKTEHAHTQSSGCTCSAEDFFTPGTVITTGSYTTPASAYVALALRDSLGRRWWYIALPVIGTLCLALFDLRWLFVALIEVFIITPFFIANAYFSRLLTPEARRAVLPKSIVIRAADRIDIDYSVKDDTDAAVPPPESIFWDEVTDVRRHGTGWIICIRKSPVTGIIVPSEAIIAVSRQQS